MRHLPFFLLVFLMGCLSPVTPPTAEVPTPGELTPVETPSPITQVITNTHVEHHHHTKVREVHKPIVVVAPSAAPAVAPSAEPPIDTSPSPVVLPTLTPSSKPSVKPSKKPEHRWGIDPYPGTERGWKPSPGVRKGY